MTLFALEFAKNQTHEKKWQVVASSWNGDQRGLNLN